MSFGPHSDRRPPPPLRPLVWAVLFVLAWHLRAHGGPWHWYWSNPLPHGNNIADFAYHTNHHFIEVTDHGQLYVSEALDQWEPRETGTRLALRGAAFLGNRLVVSGERGRILWSDDLEQFHSIDLGTEDWLEGIATSPTRAVAVGDNGAIYLSDDALNWTRQNSTVTNWLNGVARSEEVFAAVGADGLIITSPDGVEWTPRTVADGNRATLNRITWTGNGFVVAGDAFEGAGTVIFGNAAGTSWVRQTQSGATHDLIASAAESPSSRLVAGDQEVRLAFGASVIFWTDQTSPPEAAPLALYLAAISNGRQYVLGGATGLTVNSVLNPVIPGQTEWANFPSPPRNWLFDIATAPAPTTAVLVSLDGDQPIYTPVSVTNQIYAACGDLTTLMTSSDGTQWTDQFPPLDAVNQVYLALAGNARGLVAVGSAGILSFSPPSLSTRLSVTNLLTSTGWTDFAVTNEVLAPGTEWVSGNTPTTLDLLAACASPDQFVIGGQSGFLATSPNGLNWTTQVSGTEKNISGLATWSGGFVAVGEEGTLLTSSDARQWVPRVSGTTNWLFRVRATTNLLVAVGREGTIVTSPDAITWTVRASGVTNALNDVEHTVAGWFAVGNQGTLLHSDNGTDWTSDDQIITGKSLFGVATSGVQLVTVGIEGIILRTRLTPYLSPVELRRYPQDSDEHNFLFVGEQDQQFRMDEGLSLDALIRGPVRTITRADGRLEYTDRLPDGIPERLFTIPSDP